MRLDVTTLDDVKADTNQTRWPCDPRMIHARFARDEITNLAARRFAPRFARNHALLNKNKKGRYAVPYISTFLRRFFMANNYK